METKRPDILLIMCDQLRADCIAALGNTEVRTPNFDRLAARGQIFRNAYSSCPVCVPARYTIRTGCQSYRNGYYENSPAFFCEGQEKTVQGRCGGDYLGAYMTKNGYRTFGIGKFHAQPYNEEMGYEIQIPTEEIWDNQENKDWDAYARFMKEEHPEYSHIEQLHGERTNMYYVPQTSAFPKEITVESFAADRAVEQIEKDDGRPYFGFVSFVGPHPPLAPPVPFNRMYNPDHLSNPYRGEKDVDTADETVNSMNYNIWAEEIPDSIVRNLRAHYYGEISYIDWCLGKILDAVEKKGNSDNTLICFVSDHGDHMGDHGSWQKESFFEQSCHIPFLVSWPSVLERGESDEFVGLIDLFATITGAAGCLDERDGQDLVAKTVKGEKVRDFICSYYGRPGTNHFKMMVRQGDWKYIYMANGGKEILFDMKNDVRETHNWAKEKNQVTAQMRKTAIEECKKQVALRLALDASGEQFLVLPFEKFRLRRVRQFDCASGVFDFTY